ncbi:siderophore-interacting protein [Aeromicrobium sp. CF3.5]|uniref:siderophore-interacting protein n=1 Tax=Aeromicrobium sp. CF3.5 TaxID=3373078 RepID=UPI003EE7169F
MSKSQPARLTVVRTEQVAPSMRRVVFGGDGFGTYLQRHRDLGEFTDTYVKLVFLADGYDYPEPLDLDVVREEMPDAAAPVLRTYTIRWIDPDARELAIDFVVHGDPDDPAAGIAGPWAQRAQPGDVMHLRGPGGDYAPDPSADWYLLVGDETAIPAISTALEALGAGDRAAVFIEVDSPGDEVEWSTEADLDVHWLHRGGAEHGTTTLLDDAVRAWDWWPGRAQAFVHGESGLLKTVRAHVRNDREVERRDLSASAYWRRGATEEGFRVWKSEQAKVT